MSEVDGMERGAHLERSARPRRDVRKLAGDAQSFARAGWRAGWGVRPTRQVRVFAPYPPDLFRIGPLTGLA